MSFLVWTDSCTAAVSWNGGHAVYRMTPEQASAYEAEVEEEGVKYTPPPGEEIGGAEMATLISRAAYCRAVDQTSPTREIVYDDGQGYSLRRRWTHVCPITGQTWICEQSEPFSEY